MTKILPLFLMLFFIAIVSSASSVNAGGTYYVSHWNEEIVINEDASLTISEEVTFSFVTGDFEYAYRTIPHKGFDDIVSVSVTDDKGKPLGYSLEKKGFLFFPSDFEVRWKWERIYVGSEPIEKTFVLTYTLTNAMNFENTDQDRDRMYWNIITNYDVNIHDMNITVILPSKYNLSTISAASYYSISSTKPPEIANSTTHTIVNYHQSVVTAREDYTLDIHFPATVERPPPTMAQVVRVSLDMLAPWYSIGMIALGIVAIFKVRSFKKRFKDPEVSSVDVQGDEPPEDVGPPEAGVLSDMKLLRKHFDSALLDLAQRGYLTMKVESKETGFFRKSVKVESFEVALSEKGKKALQSKDPHLRRYEWHLLKSVESNPINKRELSKITSKDVNEKFGLEVIKDGLIEKGFVDPRGFEKKGASLMILGGVLALLGVAVIVLYIFMGSMNWWMNITTFFPAIVFGLARTTGPRTLRGATLHKQTNDFLEKKMKELQEEAELSPLPTIRRINELTPWLVLRPTFYKLLSAPDKAMKNLDATCKERNDILPSYLKVISSQRHTMPLYYYDYWMWRSFYATTSPSTGAPSSGGAGGGSAGGGGGGGGGGAG